MRDRETGAKIKDARREGEPEDTDTDRRRKRRDHQQFNHHKRNQNHKHIRTYLNASGVSRGLDRRLKRRGVVRSVVPFRSVVENVQVVLVARGRGGSPRKRV